ncbi:hypothetical protein DENSPDRAFT_875870 [Dentipellis sp. KUC8613]|nr:hypothetical protein DENSPDRAFT_875870 [Dentipellis sp. KUC8613]
MDFSTCQGIDARIDQLAEELSSLKTYRNAKFALTSRLPTEILIDIFLHYQALLSETGDLLVCGAPGWIDVTYVCRSWRQTALGAPILWTHIVTDEHWTQEMMRRSDTASLVVNLDLCRQGTREQRVEPVVKLILNQLDRICSLTIHGFSSIWQHVQQCIKAAPTPLRLSSLTMTCVGSYHIPDDLFGEQPLPQLTRINLHNCDIQWTSPILHGGLVTLKLWPPYIRDLQTAERVLSALSPMAMLKELVLDRLPARFGHKTSNMHVALPSLSSLHLSGGMAECAFLLSRLSFPPLARLSLLCEIGIVEGDLKVDLSWLLSKLPQIVSSARELRTLSIKQLNTALSLKIDCWTACPPPTAGGWTEPTPAAVFSLGLWWTPETVYAGKDIGVNISVPACIEPAVAALPVGQVTDLFMHPLEEGPVVDWMACFGRMDALRKVWVRGQGTSGALLKALYDDLRPGEMSTRTHLPASGTAQTDLSHLIGGSTKEEHTMMYPDLRDLSFEAINLKKGQWGQMAGPSCFSWLQKVVRVRHQRGLPIHTLRFRECSPTERMAIQLEKVVLQLEYDDT